MIILRSLLILTLVAGPVLTDVHQLNSQEVVDTEDIPLIPRNVFFATSLMDMKFSPNGKYISIKVPYKGIFNIFIKKGDKQGVFPITTFKDYSCEDYFWAQNSEQILFLRDFEGDENFRIYSVNLKSFEVIDLTPFDDTQARFVRGSENYPDEIIVAINNRDPAYHDLWAINTRTGERHLVFENNEEFGELFVDHDHQLRLGIKSDGQGGFNLFVRDLSNGSWKLFYHFDKEDSFTSEILDFSSDNQFLYYLDSSDSNTAALYSSNIGSDDLQKEKIFSDGKSDILKVLFDPKTKKPRAVITEYLRKEWFVLDPEIQEDVQYLRNFSEGDLLFFDSFLDDQCWLIGYCYDNKRVHYYLYDRNEKVANFLFSPNEALDKLPLTTMQRIVIPARDGLPLVSYLSMPRQGPRENIPMVLWVHGGPWERDSWGYNPIHQWLNNRGYAVLSVNFRGSTGFGKEFVNAANRQWSKKMHDDLIDAVNWSIDEGIADPEKIAIGGGSYGGYAALVGLTFTPEVFACGVDLLGISNLQTELENDPPYWKIASDMQEYRIGRLDEKEFLRSISPLYKADKICKPLLIMHGKNDPRVKELESVQMVEAMKKNQTPVIYVLFPDEGHGFVKSENQSAVYAMMEVFLAKELGGRCQEIGDDVENSSAMILEGKELVEGL